MAHFSALFCHSGYTFHFKCRWRTCASCLLSMEQSISPTLPSASCKRQVIVLKSSSHKQQLTTYWPVLNFAFNCLSKVSLLHYVTFITNLQNLPLSVVGMEDNLAVEIVTVMTVHIVILRVTAPSSMIHFRGSIFIQNSYTHLLHYTVSEARRTKYENLFVLSTILVNTDALFSSQTCLDFF